MVNPNRPLVNAFAAGAREMYSRLGFTKGCNFVLWLIFAGTLFWFSLKRLAYLDFWGVFCNEQRPRATGAMPGECFYYTRPGRYQIGIILHLVTVLPASLLACMQFVPVIRQRAMLVHRISGYIATTLGIVGTAAALVILRHSAGGGVDLQSGIGFLAIIFVGSLTMAIINIRRLNIEQHRAWMIRAWVYGGVIITSRIGLFIGAVVVSFVGGHYFTEPCDKIADLLKSQEATMARYAECASFFSGENLDQHAAVKANLHGDVVEVTAALNLSFGPAVWLALVLHMLGAELYLRLTSTGYESLRNASYQRQLKNGMKNPGSPGLMYGRYEDAIKWTPESGIDNIDEVDKDSEDHQSQRASKTISGWMQSL